MIGLSQWAVNLLSLSPFPAHKICINALTYLCMLQQQLKQQKIPAKNIKTFANRNQVNWTCASIVQLVEMFFHFVFFLFLINRTPSLLQHSRRHNAKAARKTMHNQLPHFACHMLPALSVARPPADLQPGHNTARNKTRPYPVRGKFAFLIHVLGSISVCSAVCALNFYLL